MDDGAAHRVAGQVIDLAVSSLQCEGGVLRDAEGRVTVRRSLGQLGAAGGPAGGALDFLQGQAAFHVGYAMDSRGIPALAVLESGQGAKCLLAVEIPPPLGGVLALVRHSTTSGSALALWSQVARYLAGITGVVTTAAVITDDLTVCSSAGAGRP